MMLHFVAEDLGVAIVPSALARASARSRQLHVLTITTRSTRLPKWRIVVVAPVPRRHLPGKTIADRFLEILPLSRHGAHRAARTSA
jgi:DNA-binding transcriptional LysR family regulator